ncbi:hypothetical protein [Treponema sp.]|uniref:hypothetical protein n=1 Tax=Treponema sp. TaxID=166 RepID=UPI00298E9A22|nr:hypothetical protein [Treponema sp.]MCR5614013.1 hypothetical protein [Treponema sp.]
MKIKNKICSDVIFKIAVIFIFISCGFVIKHVFSELNSLIKEQTELITEINSLLSKFSQDMNTKNIQIIRELDNIYFLEERTQTQITSLENKYSSLLKEEQKKRADAVASESSLNNLRLKMKSEYTRQNYCASYELCKKILLLDPSDNDTRVYKALSLYKSNALDSSLYGEILADCRILIQNGICNQEIIDIEKNITEELN